MIFLTSAAILNFPLERFLHKSHILLVFEKMNTQLAFWRFETKLQQFLLICMSFNIGTINQRFGDNYCPHLQGRSRLIHPILHGEHLNLYHRENLKSKKFCTIRWHMQINYHKFYTYGDQFSIRKISNYILSNCTGHTKVQQKISLTEKIQNIRCTTEPSAADGFTWDAVKYLISELHPATLT
jgi:hypothetical protein